jgi:hypothetical protein
MRNLLDSDVMVHSNVKKKKCVVRSIDRYSLAIFSLITCDDCRASLACIVAFESIRFVAVASLN